MVLFLFQNVNDCQKDNTGLKWTTLIQFDKQIYHNFQVSSTAVNRMRRQRKGIFLTQLNWSGPKQTASQYKNSTTQCNIIWIGLFLYAILGFIISVLHQIKPQNSVTNPLFHEKRSNNNCSSSSEFTILKMLITIQWQCLSFSLFFQTFHKTNTILYFVNKIDDLNFHPRINLARATRPKNTEKMIVTEHLVLTWKLTSTSI